MTPKSYTHDQFVAWGKQGRQKSSRKLTTEEAKRMVVIREQNRAAKKITPLAHQGLRAF